MSISDQITRLNNAKANIKQAIENKGVTVDDSATLDQYPSLIDSIEVGGGNSGDIESVWNIFTNNGTRGEYLFYNCSALTELDLSNFDTSNVTNMNNMFYNCNKLATLDVSNWNTSKVTNMTYMFSSCGSLTTLDLSDFNTSNVTVMYSMFSFSGKLTTLDLSNFNTSKVTSMNNMFSYCSALTQLDLSNFDTSKVTSMNNMFSGCNSLHTLHLDNCSNATISKIITSSGFPTNAIEGVTRTIYCKEENAAGLTAPTNWVFEFIPEPCSNCGNIDCDGNCNTGGGDMGGGDYCPYCGDPSCEYPTKGLNAVCPECRRQYKATNRNCVCHSMHDFDGDGNPDIM